MVRLNDYMIAGNADTPVEVIRDLSAVSVPVIRERLASNPNTPVDILEKLASDDEPLVRAAVAENAALPRNIAERLANDLHPDVRFSLAENVKVPPSLIRQLTIDENPYVANAASKTLDIILFELMLTEQNFEHEPGELARLGDLLVASSWLEEELMFASLKQALSQRIPLGQLLLRSGLIPTMVLLTALKLQSNVRRGQVALADAITHLAELRQSAA